MTVNDLIDDISTALVELGIEESQAGLIREIAVALVAFGALGGDAR